VTRTCTICSHEERAGIDDAIVARTASFRDIARRYGVSKDAVSRHTKEHLPELLAMARDAERYARADVLLDRIEALQSRTEAALARAEEGDNLTAIFAGIREMRRGLELIGEVTKQLDRSPTVNLSLNAEWIELRTAIVQALALHPGARSAVLGAIQGIENGSP